MKLNLSLMCGVIVALGLTVANVEAQRADPSDPANIERGRELIKKVIAARGGAKYESFTTLSATGQYTPFDKGLSQIPTPFEDTIVYPDSERVEFGKGKKKDRRIQVNVGNTGWVYDGDSETLKDQSDLQIKAFLEGLQYDVDRILRGGWREPGIEIRYYGKEELRPGERADVVLIQLNQEQTVYLWLDRKTFLPITLIYEKLGDSGLDKREVRFYQYVTYDGVKFPNIIDFYRDGIQESRVNYQSIKLNRPVSADIFTKPANIKAIK